MKKNTLYFIITALFILNGFTLIKLNNLERNTENRINQYESSNMSLRNEINNIYSNVDAKLKKQASILDNQNVTLGELNPNNFTVPVTLSITPKEYSQGLKASMQLNDKVVSMKNEGTSFATVVDADIFNDFKLKVILEQAGVQKTETIEEYNDLKNKYLLDISGGFNGQSTYGANQYSCNGKIDLQINSPQSDEPQKITIVNDLNGSILNQRSVDPSRHASVDIKDNLKIASGDKLTTYAIVQDSYGLNYKYILNVFEPENLKNPSEANREWEIRRVTEISDRDGKILYSPKRF